MHGLILAGGEGARLATSGLLTPKPFLEIDGGTLIGRAATLLDALGVTSLTCLVREPHAARAAAILDGRARIVACATPSSLHTLALGFAALPPGPVFCALVDAVMPAADLRRVFAVTAADLEAGADAVLAVTSFADVERPLYVARGPGGRVERISEQRIDPVCVTGGVHGFGDDVRVLAADLVGRGRGHLRALIQLTAALGLDVTSTLVERIIDVDRRSDLEAARALIEGETER